MLIIACCPKDSFEVLFSEGVLRILVRPEYISISCEQIHSQPEAYCSQLLISTSVRRNENLIVAM